jgi:hypothetical protein
MISVICGLILAGAAYFITSSLLLGLIIGLVGTAGLFVIGLVLSTMT